MIAVIINAVAIVIGSTIGLIFKKGISKKYTDAIMVGLGLCTIYIGISGALKGKNTLILIISMVIGVTIGTWIDIDKKINTFGSWLGSKNKSSSNDSISVSEGFITSSLLFV